MYVEEVLDTAFRGCGTSLAQAKQLRLWQRLSQRFAIMGQKYKVDSQTRRLLRAGPHILGSLLSRNHSLEEAAALVHNTRDPWCYEAEFLAAICVLGEALQRRAFHCLPEQLCAEAKDILPEDPLRFILSEETRRIRLTPKQAVTRWQKGSVEQREEVARLLARAFETPLPKHFTSEKDRANQPKERVLPHFFGRWDPSKKEGPQPNCLGKSIMVAAFFRRVRAARLAVVPIKLANATYCRQRGEAVSISLTALREYGVPLSHGRRTSLLEIARAAKRSAQELCWAHMGVAVAIHERSWRLVDPNMLMASHFHTDWQMPERYKTLTQMGRLMPGLSLLAEDPQCGMTGYEWCVSVSRVNCHLLGPLAKACFDRRHTKEELVDQLAQSRVLDTLLSWQEFEALKYSRQARKRCATILLRNFAKLKTMEGKILQEVGMELSSSYQGRTTTSLLDEITDDQAQEAMATLCYRLATRSIYLIDEEWQLGHSYGDLIHPRLEMMQVGPGLAIHVLAHVALAMGRRASQAMEKQLNRHCFDMYRLLYSAGQIIQPKAVRRSLDADSLQSLATLRSLPFVLPGAEQVLEILRQDIAG